MFQALGTHGPELSPTMGLVLDVLLLGAAFWLLAGPNRRSVHDVVLMATLVVSVSLIRVVMQPLPNIQPVTVACLLVGAQLGARRGAAFAVMVTMLSNFFMGDGWWTLFQAGGWGMVAVLGSRLSLVVDGAYNATRTCFASLGSAFIFGFVVSFSILDGTFGAIDFLFYLANGLPFDMLHALGNLTFAVWFGAWFSSILNEQASLESIERAVVERHGIDA
jgi:energy-coupling factor transport system substrate-specific component